MGSRTYDFLTESFLFDHSLIDEEFRTFDDNEIKRELARYREFCLSIVPELQMEVSSDPSSLKIFSGVRRVSLDLLTQSAFYVHQHVLYDPLFPLTEDRTDQSAAFAKFLGLGDSALDKTKLAHTLRYLKALTPMVAANYVKLLPTSYFFEAPSEVPFTYSETGFADRVPSSLLEFFHKKAILESGKKGHESLVFDGTFEIGRIISVSFEDHDRNDEMGYTLLDMEVLDKNKVDGTAKVRMYMPDDIPDESRFNAWVNQSVNQTAGHVYYRLLIENSFAAKFGASYLTESPFVFELLEQIVPVENDIQTNTANSLFNLELEFLADIDVETLMKIRCEDGEAFQNFRTELDKQLRDLRQVSDPRTLEIRLENVIHELSRVQVPQINKKLASLRKKLFAETALVTGSLFGAVQSSGWTIPVALIAALQGYKAMNEYRQQQKENPAFFLWKVLSASKNRM